MVTQSNDQVVTSHTYKGTKNLNGSKTFNSGNPSIDKFAKSNLKLHAKASGNAVTVLVDNSSEQKLVGYVTLVTHTLSREELKLSTQAYGKTPLIPVVKLNMLGVSLDYQKKGYGEELMHIAFLNTKTVCQAVGCTGLYLEAAPDAVAFYSKLGFESLSEPNQDNGIVPMFLHVDAMP